MTKEEALLVIEEKRLWADLISGEKDELYDAIDVILTDIATLRSKLSALVMAGEGIANRDYTWIEGVTAVEFKPMQTLRQALAAAKGEVGG